MGISLNIPYSSIFYIFYIFYLLQANDLNIPRCISICSLKVDLFESGLVIRRNLRDFGVQLKPRLWTPLTPAPNNLEITWKKITKRSPGNHLEITCSNCGKWQFDGPVSPSLSRLFGPKKHRSLVPVVPHPQLGWSISRCITPQQ